jgi:hypothetical protein
MNEHLITLERLLQFHDWHYDYSDDHSVWQRGQREHDAIGEEQRRLIHVVKVPLEEVMALTDKYRPKD